VEAKCVCPRDEGSFEGSGSASDDGFAHARASTCAFAKRRGRDTIAASPAVRGAFARRRDAESARTRRARRDEVFATCPIETARVRERASRAYLRDARAAAEGGGLARLDGDGGGERGDGGHGGGDVDACTWSGGARIGRHVSCASELARGCRSRMDMSEKWGFFVSISGYILASG